MTELKEYRIPVEWRVYGYMTIEASSLQNAVNHACDQESLPTDWVYLEDSFMIGEVELRESYPNEAVTIPEECAG